MDRRDWRRELVRPTHRDFLAEMDFEGSSMAMPMDVDDDDLDSVDTFGHGGGFFSSSGRKPVDSDFFNRFQDDFDDSDIN
ncbi:unnamed protein product [Arabis nemorensis]|uniref:Uncharacterized protein n=1 Tax=Arabis nemorensis TaxID=586526 RepID=A0A565BA93_9BRAS|nr:unnamed protein product [Arabis nemorensis]